MSATAALAFCVFLVEYLVFIAKGRTYNERYKLFNMEKALRGSITVLQKRRLQDQDLTADETARIETELQTQEEKLPRV